MTGPSGVPVSDATVYSGLNPQHQLGMSADHGTLSIAMCEAENITAVKEDLIYQSTEFPGGNSIIVHMRVNLIITSLSHLSHQHHDFFRN